MKRLLAFFVFLTLPAFAGDRVILCGWDEIFMIDSSVASPSKIWSWKAKDHPEIPAELAKTFGLTDECKPVEGGKRMLICSSGGGCALLELPSGKAVWSANVKNAHSIEALPGGRILVASSVGGDKLVLFDVKTGDKVLWSTPLHSAHGLVWDGGRKLLYALGYKELRTYSLKDWDGESPSLVLVSTVEIKDKDGHDLRAVPGSADLVFSSDRHVWLFDRDKTIIRPHPEWANLAQVKGIDIHPKSGRAIIIQANGKDWWNDTFELRKPPGKMKLEGEHLYKGRWMIEQ